MKRLVAPLVGLAVLCVVGAAMVAFYLAPTVVKVPLDQDSKTVSEATGATFLLASADGLQIRTGRLRATREVTADVAAEREEAKAGRDRAVWDVRVTVEDVDSGDVINKTYDRVAIDRVTGEAEACCGEGIANRDGKVEPVQHQGLTYKFPVHTEQRSYDWFDMTNRSAAKIHFKAVEEIDGTEVYRFEQSLPPTRVQRDQSEIDLLLRRFAPDFDTGELRYSNTRTVWVEPTTGVIVRGREQQRQTLLAGTSTEVTLLDAELEFTAETVKAQRDLAESKAFLANLAGSYAPVGLLALGVASLGAAGAIGWLGRSGRRRPEEDHELAGEQATAEQPHYPGY